MTLSNAKKKLVVSQESSLTKFIQIGEHVKKKTVVLFGVLVWTKWWKHT